MTLTVAALEAQLRSCADLAPIASLAVEDISGNCGTSFAVTVSSAAFAGKSRLAQQRLVHKALGAMMGDIHALTLKCRVPAASTESS